MWYIYICVCISISKYACVSIYKYTYRYILIYIHLYQVGRIIHLCGVVTARRHSKHAGWLRVERLLGWSVSWYIPQTIAARSAAPTWRSFGPASARPCRWGYLANWLAGRIIHHCGIVEGNNKNRTTYRWAVSSTFVALSQHGSTASMLGGWGLNACLVGLSVGTYRKQ